MTNEAEVSVSIEPTADVANETQLDSGATNEAQNEETSESTEKTAKEKFESLPLEERIRQLNNARGHDREKLLKARAKAERIANEAKQYKAELEALRAEREQKATAPQKPKMEDFDSVEDYVDAVATFRAKENNQQAPKEAVLTPEQQQEQIWIAQREAVVTQQAREFIKTNPEAVEIIQDNADVIDDFPQHIKNVLLASENPTLAVVNLVKEGRLEYLGYLPKEVAAMEVQRALSQGGAKAAVSKAPAPISTAKGTAVGTKSPESMSSKELLKWVNS